MKWITNRWNSYKYRFVPWIALNINNKTTVKINQTEQNNNSDHLLNNLLSILKTFENYASLREDLELYSKLHNVNQKILLDKFGYSLAKAGNIVGIYPGTVYQPYQPILIQSIRNTFLFRCADGVLIDGKDCGISRTIYRSCSPRDQIGMLKTSDTSWLTPWPVNPLNNGQYVNNGGGEKNPANVCYQEIDLPLSTFPVGLRKFVPNVNYASISQECSYYNKE